MHKKCGRVCTYGKTNVLELLYMDLFSINTAKM